MAAWFDLGGFDIRNDFAGLNVYGDRLLLCRLRMGCLLSIVGSLDVGIDLGSCWTVGVWSMFVCLTDRLKLCIVLVRVGELGDVFSRVIRTLCLRRTLCLGGELVLRTLRGIDRKLQLAVLVTCKMIWSRTVDVRVAGIEPSWLVATIMRMFSGCLLLVIRTRALNIYVLVDILQVPCTVLRPLISMSNWGLLGMLVCAWHLATAVVPVVEQWVVWLLMMLCS